MSRQTSRRHEGGSARRHGARKAPASHASALGNRGAGARAADGEPTGGYAPVPRATHPAAPSRSCRTAAPRPLCALPRGCRRRGPERVRELEGFTRRYSSHKSSSSRRCASNSCRAWHAWARCVPRRLSLRRCRVPAALRCVFSLSTAAPAVSTPAGRGECRAAPRPLIQPLHLPVLRSRSAAVRRWRPGELHRWPGLPSAGLRYARPDAGLRAWT